MKTTKTIAAACCALLSACATVSPSGVSIGAHDGRTITLTGAVRQEHAFADRVLDVQIDGEPALTGIVARNGGAVTGRWHDKPVMAHCSRVLVDTKWYEDERSELVCDVLIDGRLAGRIR